MYACFGLEWTIPATIGRHRKMKDFPKPAGRLPPFSLIRGFVFDTRLWKTKHPRKRFQNFRQSSVLSTDRIEIHQSEPLVWPSDLLYVMLAGCDWWTSIRSVENTQDWRKFWKRLCGCFVFQSHVSTKTVVTKTSLPQTTFTDSRCSGRLSDSLNCFSPRQTLILWSPPATVFMLCIWYSSRA